MKSASSPKPKVTKKPTTTTKAATKTSAPKSTSSSSSSTRSLRTSSTSSVNKNGSSLKNDKVNISKESGSKSESSSSLPNLSWGDDSQATKKAGEAGKPTDAGKALELDEGTTLSKRSKNNPEKVQQLQETLKKRGIELEADGKFGPKTQKAVRDFQEKHGLAVDGIVGPETLGALNKPNESGAGQKVGDKGGIQPTGSAARGKEVKGGRASMKSGSIQLKDPKTGKVLGTYKFNNGGAGRGAIPWGDYEVSNGRRRSDKSTMQKGGYGYSFDLTQKGMPTGKARDPRFRTDRSLLRIHPDGGGKGTIGCVGIEGGRDVQKSFYENAQKLAAANGGKFSLSFRPEGYKGESALNGSGNGSSTSPISGQNGNASGRVSPNGNGNSSGNSTNSNGSRMSLNRGQTLRKGRGNSPAQVRQLQEMLNQQSGGNLEIDGKFGPKTENALRAFQQQKGIGVDGVFGPESLGALNGGQGQPVNGGQNTNGGQATNFGGSGRLGQQLPEKMQSLAPHFQKYGEQYGVDPKFLAAISMLETARGTSSAFRNKRNAMGVSNSKGPISFQNPAQSIERMARVLASRTGPYKGANTINSIGRIYAPPGAGNDPHGTNGYWATGVSKFYKSLGGNPSAVVVNR